MSTTTQKLIEAARKHEDEIAAEIEIRQESSRAEIRALKKALRDTVRYRQRLENGQPNLPLTEETDDDE